MRQKDIRPAPALIEFKGMKFLITDRPSDNNIQNYIVVRSLVSVFVCVHPRFSCSILIHAGTEKT